jgi:hypothetical protein
MASKSLLTEIRIDELRKCHVSGRLEHLYCGSQHVFIQVDVALGCAYVSVASQGGEYTDIDPFVSQGGVDRHGIRTPLLG